MNNKRSIFFKCFSICSAVILISFVCLGAVLLLVSSRYFIEEKKSILSKNAETLAQYTRESMIADPSGWKISVTGQFTQHSMSSNGDYILCDKNGEVVLNSSVESDSSVKSIDPTYLKAFSDKCSYLNSDLGGTFPGNCHIMGITFKANGPIYYVLAYSSESEQDDYIWTILEIFVVSAVFVLIIAMILVYISTMRLTEPVKEIATVSKKIGEGDFSATVPSYDIEEYDQLSKAFNEMAAGLKSYDTMKNSFLANVSHELRTPMTSIGGFVDGLIDGTIPKSEEKKYLKIISSEVHRLARLVRSMLNLAKIEAGELELSYSKFSVLEPIVDTLMTFETRIDDKEIEIKGLDIDRMYLFADNDLIHQVMYNLIENAIKFVNKGGYIEFAFEKTNDTTTVHIKNSGEGLTEDELPLVFDRFYKTDKSRGLDKTGVGLGLNIVRSIIKLHGGKIMVRSVKGEYTEFVFTLPNDKPTEKHEKPLIETKSQKEENPDKKKVGKQK